MNLRVIARRAGLASLVLLVLGLGIAQPTALADTVILTDGRKFEGTITEQSDTEIQLQLASGILFPIKRADIKEIIEDDKGALEEAPASAGGGRVPRAARAPDTGVAAVDEARRRAAQARADLEALVDSLDTDEEQRERLIKRFEKLKVDVKERERELAQAQRETNDATREYNRWVQQNNAEASRGKISDQTRRSLSKAERTMKSARRAQERLQKIQNDEVAELEKLAAKFDKTVERTSASAEDLIKAIKDADEAWVRLCEAERRAGIAAGEEDAGADGGEGEKMSAEGATARWLGATEVSGDLAALAGRRVAFEARIESYDSGSRRLTVAVGTDADPGAWTTRLSVLVRAPLEAPGAGIAVLEGLVGSADDRAQVEVDRVSVFAVK